MANVASVPGHRPLRIILGAGEQLDLRRPEDFRASFAARRVDAFLAEHVWEHLTEKEGRAAARLCFRYRKPDGLLRCAVPDANVPDEGYQRTVQVGGPGPADHPAADHEIVHDDELFRDVFASAGSEARLLEYCDEEGRFHHRPWDPAEGPSTARGGPTRGTRAIASASCPSFSTRGSRSPDDGA